MLEEMGGLATAQWTGSRPLPIGSRSIGVSLQPAIPRRVAPQQSPLPLHQSPTIVTQSRSGQAIKCAARLSLPGCSPGRARRARRQQGCHFYFAQRVTFLPCADTVRRRPRSDIAAAVQRALALVQLGDLGDRKPNQLSGGQQQRVALARALVYEPGILVMDEPLGALDKKLREEIQVEIRRIHRQLGVTLLYVTHDQEEALRMSDRIAVFDHGRVVQVGTGEELYDTPATRFVGGFIGSSNFITATVVGAEGAVVMVRLPDGSIIAV